MLSTDSRLVRAVLASPFLFLARRCLAEMDLDKMKEYIISVLSSENPGLAWNGGTIPIYSRFYGVASLDDLWRGASVAFSVSSLAIDGPAWWQMLSFLTDLGPLYAVWIIEACRPASRWTPAYLPTVGTFAAQIFGIGPIAPIFYYLYLVLGPRASDLAHRPSRQLDTWKFALLLPLMLGFHTLEVFGAYLLPDPVARHYWVWAWQMSPLWIGLANFISARVIGRSLQASRIASPAVILPILCVISSAVWLFVLMFSPYPMAKVFLPDPATQTDGVLHIRRALQVDQLSSFTASFLWLAYLLLDMYSAGLVQLSSFWPVALLPVVLACAGPGVAFALAWAWRESMLA